MRTAVGQIFTPSTEKYKGFVGLARVVLRLPSEKQGIFLEVQRWGMYGGGYVYLFEGIEGGGCG